MSIIPVPPVAVAIGVLLTTMSTAFAGPPAALESAGPVVAGRELARVGDTTITVADFENEMQRRARGLPGSYVTAEERRALLDEMIEFRALVTRARSEGFDRRPDVVAAFERILVARYKQERIDPGLDAVAIEDWEIESFYEQHKLDYAIPERHRAAIIRIGVASGAPEDEWVAAERRAALALDEVRSLDASTTHFGAVAVRHSEDRGSRYRGGVIGWVTPDVAGRSKWPAEVLGALFALERPGEIAPIVRASDGVYLVRLVERQEPRVRSLAALEDGFRNQILREKQRGIYDGLLREALAEANVVVDEALFATIAPPASSTTERQPPPLPAG